MKLATFAILVALASAGVAAALTFGRHDPDSLELSAATEGELCTTLGVIQTESKPWRVQSPKLRATVQGSAGRQASLEFRFLGETEQRSRLKSGVEQAQLGLKLLSRDTCNVLYVMWRRSPGSELVVSLKRNPAEHQHSGCENRGYSRLRPEGSSPLPRLEPGQVHQLSAHIEGRVLRVHVDERLVWEGSLPDKALDLRGNAGVRSDNLRFELLTLKTEPRASGGDPCRAAPEEVDQRRP